jgi:cobalamin biosynthesis protein CobD/CbiB
METEVRRRRPRAASVFSGVAAFVVTPFVITAVFGLVKSVPTSAPFLAALVVAVWLWTRFQALRPLAVGVLIGTVLHAVALAWLFGTFGTVETMRF